MSEDAVLVAGTRCYYQPVGASVGSYLELNGVRTLGKIGSTGSFVDQSTLKDTTKRYVPGMADTEESTLKLAIYSGDKNQSDFIHAAQQRKNVKFKVVIPPDSNGKSLVSVFDIALSGQSLPEMSDGNVIAEFDISYRISGSPAFTFADAGEVYSISAIDVTKGGAFTVADGEYLLVQGDNFISSSQGVGASVMATVESNAITSVNIVSGGVGFKVDDTLSISKVGGVIGTTPATLTVSSVS